MPSLKEPNAAFGNVLLSALPPAEYERLSPHLEVVRLTPGKILYNAGNVVRHAYFPNAGMISLLSTTESGRTIEIGMIGNEGMTGIPIILRGSMSPYQVVVQIAGNALRVRGDMLSKEFNRGGRLQDLLLRYTNALLSQIVQSAACNQFHTVEERLCRWLLVSSDHAQTDVLHLTQEFLSHILGVPRTSVTTVARSLQEQGLIRYRRGKIVILDRLNIEAASCECYRLIRESINRLLAA